MKYSIMSRSSRNEADPLSEVLSLLKPRSYMSGGIDAGGAWSFQFAPSNCFLCFALVTGQCWLAIDGEDEAVRLQAGDFVALPHGPAFRLASDLALPPVDVRSVVTGPMHGDIISWQGGGACLGLTAFFTFAAEHANILLGLLPALVHLRSPADRAVMQWYLERMMAVLQDPQPGDTLLGEHLAQMMLIEMLRLHVAQQDTERVGWLFALSDRQLRAVITAMHERPGHGWTVQELAQLACMSRSAFSLHFKKKVGMPAMAYLVQWRMLLASDRLLQSQDAVSTIALELGYRSESAFSFAFKREMGCSPRQYCRVLAG
ncbi:MULTISPECIES: AraC family transcriptional regulator [unclassified Janthinobacterium]|uniref:AraC family transcriptional regulator n=1 Tax=unclassified Janthinobacterium TaxID=2610881 RepID=UPI00161B6E7E|nr:MULTISPECIES: AraC family transcriptional regulator [unclassified Janthinobacterium]MBB5368172.1 AraC-like DNA-binding protein [Janthinobacterium sp. K2C7]MBB5379351.1 AraC-like DNA-binding protein [Janthinobacterium sp. K2Li3]MBB5386554.1 AraC-like DNA-binding protein [Janthinobacterium sp. K2E3]